MRSYHIEINVTTTYIAEVHAESEQEAIDKAWNMEPNEVEAQGSVEISEVSNVGGIEEIQREDEE